MKNLLKRASLVGIGLTIGVGGIALTAATLPDQPIESAPAADASAPSNWRDRYVPCDTPSGDTMVVGCYWDKGDQPYMVTDDGETFLVDDATGQRTYVESGEEPWRATDPVAEPEPVAEPVVAPTPDLPDITLVPCPVEDAENCYWDAARMGNGTGRSFVNIDGTFYYAE